MEKLKKRVNSAKKRPLRSVWFLIIFREMSRGQIVLPMRTLGWRPFSGTSTQYRCIFQGFTRNEAKMRKAEETAMSVLMSVWSHNSYKDEGEIMNCEFQCLLALTCGKIWRKNSARLVERSVQVSGTPAWVTGRKTFPYKVAKSRIKGGKANWTFHLEVYETWVKASPPGLISGSRYCVRRFTCRKRKRCKWRHKVEKR